MKTTSTLVSVLAVLSTLAPACGDEGDGSTTGCESDQSCDDGNSCTVDTCTGDRRCIHTAVTVDDGITCTTDACDNLSGEVTHTPNHALCPSQTCVTTNACDPQNGDPVTGCNEQPVTVSDGVDCTTDACDANGLVTHTPDHGACPDADGITCTEPQCDAVLGCIEDTNDLACTPSNACVASAVCEPVAGDPTTGCLDVWVSVDDNVDCTVDACDTATGIISHTPDHGACTEVDGFTCTVPACDLLLDCIEVAHDTACDDGQACSSDTCDPATGDSQTGCAYALSHVSCDDGVNCTTDTCAPGSGCANTADDNACEPTDYCNVVNDCQLRRPFLATAVITEIMLGAGELIEVHNPGTSDGDLFSFTLAASMLSATVRAASDPSGANGDPVLAPAGGVIYGVPNPADPADIPVDATFVYGDAGAGGLLSPSGDRVALRSPVAGTLDEVDFRNLHTDPDTAVPADAFPARAGSSIQLDPAQLDPAANDDGDNWCITFRSAHTAGAGNGSCTEFVINEIMYDGAIGADTSDAGKSFIELAGPGGAVVANLRVRGVEAGTTSTGVPQQPDIRVGALLTGARARVGGIFVIADNSAGPNTVVPANRIDLAATLEGGFENGVDALQLLLDDGAGSVAFLDALSYGTPANNITADTVNGFPLFEGTPSIDVNQQISLARDLASTDTHNNAVDFVADPSPSPGVPNQPVSTTVTAVSPNDGLASVATPGVVITGTDIAFNAVVTLAGAAIPTAQCSYAGIPTQIVCTAQVSSAVIRGDVVVQNTADRGGTSGALAAGWTYTGVLNETDFAGEADWCNLQFPPSFSVQTGQSIEPIYGRIYETGITEPAGAHPGVIAELGFAASGANPVTTSWLFYSATFNTQLGNDDEYQASFTAPAAGSYLYTYRFSLDEGLNFTYCDLDGAGANAALSFDPLQLGVMTVTP